ncbi:MAG: oligosaccharide flippase family protein [Candidatus Levyibacteriota bacterium]
MGYKKDVIKGVSWTGSLSFFTKAIGFLETIILARILAPEQFGAYAIALLALGLLEVLTETGVNIVLIQEKEIDHLVSSAWVVSIFRGLFIAAILFLSAPFIAQFFNSPLSLTLLTLISIAPLIRGFINPSVVKFQKELMFGKDFGYKFTVLLIDTSFSILVTYLTQNPVGIVIGLLVGVITEMLLSYFIVLPRPSFQFEKTYIAKIFHRGKWITATTIFDYLFHNADNIIVGRLLGAAYLGIYQLAYSIAVTPLTEVGKVFLQVSLPIFVKIGIDGKRLRSAFIKMCLSIFCITFPVVLILYFSPSIFVFLLGNKWAAITAIIPLLALLGFLNAFVNACTSLFLSVQKQNYATVVTFINIVVLLIAIVPLVHMYGIFGAGLAALIGVMTSFPFVIYYTVKILKFI